MKKMIRQIWPDLIVEGELGKGPFSVVYEAVDQAAGGQPEVVKVISFKGDNQVLEAVMADLKFMKNLKETGAAAAINDFKTVEKSDSEGCDIFVRMEKLTPLSQMIEEKKFNDADVIKIAQDVLDDLEVIEDKGAAHLNLKPSNILMDGTGHYKLADLYTTRRLEVCTGIMPTPKMQTYIAPEMLAGKEADITADIYALGRILLEILPAGGSGQLKQMLEMACDANPQNRFVKPMVMKKALSFIKPDNQAQMNKQAAVHAQPSQPSQSQKKNTAVPIIIGIVAALVLLTAVAAVFFLGRAGKNSTENENIRDAVPVLTDEADDHDQTADRAGNEDKVNGHAVSGQVKDNDTANNNTANNNIANNTDTNGSMADNRASNGSTAGNNTSNSSTANDQAANNQGQNHDASGSNQEIADMRIDFDYSQSYSSEQAVVTAYKGDQVVWSYTTNGYDPAQCRRITEIGSFDVNGGSYYIVEDGAVLCFDLYTGDMRWKNEEFKGSLPSQDGAVLDQEGNLYLCGSLSPDLFIVSAKTGETVNRINDFDTQYTWPFKLNLSGDSIEITFEAGPSNTQAVLYYSIKDGTISADQNASGSTSSSVSTAANSENAGKAIDRSVIQSVSASSYLDEPQYGLTHDAWCAADGNTATVWVEDKAGQGEGEWVKLNLSEKCMVSGFTIYNGHQESQDLYQKNSRVRELKVTLSDGTEQTFTLSDQFGKQDISFDTPLETDSVTFTIVSVYGGNKYEDTCISEIQLKGTVK